MFTLLIGLLFSLFFFVLTFSVFVLPPMLLRAFVMSKMWIWFAVPILHVIPLGWIACIGLSAFIGMFIPSSFDLQKYKKNVDEVKTLNLGKQIERIFEGMTLGITTPLITLLIGWLTKDYVLALVN